MEDQNPLKISPFNLPPGCRFYPSQDQIFTYYLTNKNSDGGDRDGDGDRDQFGHNLIEETDFYRRDPFELPESGCFSYGYRGRKQHWYCYMPAGEREGWRRMKWRAGRGFWKRRSRVRNVFGRGKERVVLGTRTSFVFCLGKLGKLGKNAVEETDWIMHQYALIDQLKAFVLCRIFVKSRSDNSLSDHVPSSCAEESISATHHIGAEAMASDNHLIDTVDGLLEFPMNLEDLLSISEENFIELDDFNGPPLMQTNEMVRFEDLLSISEENFIELDDFNSPLLGTDEIG